MRACCFVALRRAALHCRAVLRSGWPVLGTCMPVAAASPPGRRRTPLCRATPPLPRPALQPCRYEWWQQCGFFKPDLNSGARLGVLGCVGV